MGRGVPVDVARTLQAILILTLVIGVASGASCERVKTPKAVMDLIVSSVYTDRGYFPFQSMQVVPDERAPVERNTMILVDPSSNTAMDITMSDSAADPGSTIVGNAYVKGPFIVTILISDTLRFAYKNGYGDGPYLKERFEGRYERGASSEAITTLIKGTFKSLLPSKALREALEHRTPIKNRITGDTFSVSIVCASGACKKEIYSLLTKYMNLGASGEMVVEMGAAVGGFFLGKITGELSGRVRAVMSGIPDKVRLRGRLELEGLTKYLKTIRLAYTRAALDTYLGLTKEEQGIIKTILSNPNAGLDDLTRLSPQGRKTLYTLMDTLETFRREGRTEEEIFKEIKDVVGLDIEQIPDYSNVIEYVRKRTPLFVSQLDTIDYGISKSMGKAERYPSVGAALGKFVLTPFGFYVARAGFSAIHKPTYIADKSYGIFSVFPIQQSYEIPPEWSTIELQPLRDRDAVVDVLVNNGSDPGDMFKTVISITGIGLINKFFKSTIGKDLAGPLVVNEEDERTYSMKDAITTVAVPQNCPSCHLVQSGDSVTIEAPATTFIALTENSRPEEGSTVIAFFRKANMYANGEKVLDMSDKENACVNKCSLLKGVLSIGPLKDPTTGMFVTSLLLGYVAPAVVGPWGSIFLAYPLASYLVYGNCHSCVDTTFGYYIHLRALTDVEDTGSMEENIANSIISSLQGLGLKVDVNGLINNVIKNRVEKKQVMLYSKVSKARGVLNGPVVAEWVRPEETLPVGKRKGRLILVGEKNVILDGETLSVDGNSVTSSLIPYGVPDSTIPAYIIPEEMVQIEPLDRVITAYSSVNYEIAEDIRKCLQENGIEPGKLMSIVTSSGSIDFDEEGAVAKLENWGGSVSRVEVKKDFRVRILDADVDIEDNKTTFKERWIDGGDLKAIVFDNLSIVRVGDRLYAWERVLYSVPKEAVSSVSLSTDGNSISMEIQPSPDATPKEIEDIENMNKRLKGVTTLEGSRMAVAIVRGKDGKLHLRIYDKEKNTLIDEEIIGISQDPNDPTALQIRTRDKNGEEKTHVVKVEVASDGTPVLKIDGKSGGILKGVQTPDGFLYFNPETGEWQLINGVLAPLAEAFKKGIKMSFQGGVGVGTPAGGIVINTPPQQPPLSLPLFEGWEIVPVILGILLVFIIVQGRVRI